MIVFDASSLVGAAIGADGVPRRAVHAARRRDRFALSTAVLDEVVEVLHRPRLARFTNSVLRDELLDLLVPGAASRKRRTFPERTSAPAAYSGSGNNAQIYGMGSHDII